MGSKQTCSIFCEKERKKKEKSNQKLKRK